VPVWGLGTCLAERKEPQNRIDVPACTHQGLVAFAPSLSWQMILFVLIHNQETKHGHVSDENAR
jgi:hypothetical protein